MSFLSNINDQRTLPPILRLLDEFDQYSRSNDRHSHPKGISFVPKFDIRENKEVYELYGEFPGIDQKDIHIEFTDASTLTIKGHADRNSINSTYDTKTKPRTVTVEDVDEDEETPKNNQSVQVKANEQSTQPEEKYLVKERNVGEFSRTFGFPVQVVQEGVKASMKNGILNVVVPKAKKHPGRRIFIE